MKIRLAKKIMKCDGDVSRWYWAYRLAKYCEQNTARYYNDYRKNENTNFKSILRCDHRIIKAISLTNHWNARRYINELIKSNKKHPFKLRDVQCDAKRLKQYNV